MTTKNNEMNENIEDRLNEKILSRISINMFSSGIDDIEEPEDEPRSKITTSENEVINYPKQGETYSHKDKLTLDIDGKPVTQKLNDWVRFDPVTLHKALVETDFTLTRDNYRILMSSLRSTDMDYYRKTVGLDILVDITGHSQPVDARSLYKFEPVKFYKWWSSNEKKVYMTTREKIQLFLKVESIKSGTLLKKHTEFMKKLRPTGTK